MPDIEIFSNSWNIDERIARVGIDINYSDYSSKTIRKAIIAVIDTDIYIEHNDFYNIWKNMDEISEDGIDNDKNGYIDDLAGWNFVENNSTLFDDNDDTANHGTAVVGILSAKSNRYIGVLNNSLCEVMPIKALSGRTLKGNIDNVIKAIEYAEDNGAVVCCLSIATYNYNKKLNDTIRKSNMIFVVASGNDGYKLDDNLKIYPACIDSDNIISVADVRCDGKLSAMSNYSNEYIDVAAPGSDIVSTYPNNKYGYVSGTSFAVPFVSGLAGMIYSSSAYELSSSEIIEIICNNVYIQEELKDKVKYGGIINYSKSIDSIIKHEINK